MALLLPQLLRSGGLPVRPARWWAGAAVVVLLLLAGLAWWAARPAPVTRVASQSLPPATRQALAECAESAMLLHDVRWAAACMLLAQQDETRDGSTDCELPDAHAARLNELFHRAEQRCLAEAGARRR